MRKLLALACIAGAFGALDATAAPGFNIIDQTNIGNATFGTTSFINGNLYPAGDQTFAGVPFALPADRLSMWHSELATGPNPRSIDIPVGLFGVDAVYTLIGSWWGETVADGSYASITFVGTGIDPFVVALDGNFNIRDYNQSIYTNTLSDPDTQEVWNSGLGQRLDLQTFDLPAEFLMTTLEKIVIVDDGGSGFQRVFIAGSTAWVPTAPIPEPSTIALSALGLVGAAAALRRRRTATSAG
jgi:hypothetical protein